MRRRAEELKEWANEDRRNTHTERAVIWLKLGEDTSEVSSSQDAGI